MSVQGTTCCGVDEYYNFYHESSVKEFLRNCVLATKRNGDDITPFVLFTDTEENKINRVNGEKLKAYIEEHKLGTVYRTASRINSNSGNHLRAYMWTVNKKNLLDWYKSK